MTSEPLPYARRIAGSRTIWYLVHLLKHNCLQSSPSAKWRSVLQSTSFHKAQSMLEGRWFWVTVTMYQRVRDMCGLR